MNQLMDAGMSGLINSSALKKDSLIRNMVTKVIEEGNIESSLKTFFYKKDFLGNFYPMIYDLNKRFAENSIPSLQFMKTKHKLLPEYSDLTQHDISELLKEIFIQEMFTVEYLKNTASIKSGNIPDLKKFLEYCSSLLVEIENVQMCSFADQDDIERTLNQIRDRSDIQTFGNLKAFNALEMRNKQLVAILAASGSGKSLVLEKLHAESKDDIVLHFSLELPKSLFLRRIFVALGWIPDDQIEFISDEQVRYYSRKMAKEFPTWHYTCLDTESSIINCSKVEKMIKYYRSKYGNDKGIKVIIDYAQLLEENFDALTCRVNKHLHDIAVKTNSLIIEGLQANDEASKYEHPAETSMISFVKSLKNDCDIIQSFKGMNLEEESHKTMLVSKTKKHRMGKSVNFTYMIDHNHTEPSEDNWKLITPLSNYKSKKLDLVNGTNKDFPEEEIA